jgi:hypothetical protein
LTKKGGGKKGRPRLYFKLGPNSDKVSSHDAFNVYKLTYKQKKEERKRAV